MRIASALVAFVFLSGAAAAVVPDIRHRNAAVDDGNGGHNASTSNIPIPPSGLPTEPFPHSMSSSVPLPPSGLPPASSMQSMSGGVPPYPASFMSAHPSFTPSLPPLSGGPAPTGGLPPLGFPSGGPYRPVPSARNHAMANRRALVADDGPHPVPPMPNVDSADPHRPTGPPTSSLPSPPPPPPSGVPSGTSGGYLPPILSLVPSRT